MTEIFSKENENKNLSEKNKNKSSSSKRIGAAKEEMKDFDISLEEFNSISSPDFGLNH